MKDVTDKEKLHAVQRCTGTSHPCVLNRVEDYSTNSADDHRCSDVNRYISKRQYGLRCRGLSDSVRRHVTRQMPLLYREREYDVEKMNKIFTSYWLTDRQVVFGTKCNKTSEFERGRVIGMVEAGWSCHQVRRITGRSSRNTYSLSIHVQQQHLSCIHGHMLVVMDLLTGHMTRIPLLRSSEQSIPADCPCGIHSMSVNPSRTLLATGAEHTNDLAVYKLPTFDPMCVGEGAHNDWLFDMTWIDDQFLVTGSRDSKLALWRIRDDDNTKTYDMPDYFIKSADVIKEVPKLEKVRSLTFNENKQEVAVLSLNARLYLWDVGRFELKDSVSLVYPKENVCLCMNNDCTQYAIGSQSNVTLLDAKTMETTNIIQSKHRGCGIRSLSFQDKIVTIGTGVGLVLFYDLRARRYLDCQCGYQCNLTLGNGWLLHDSNYRDFFMDQVYPNAIYTHSYDTTGTRLFVAGGPLPAGLYGNYAALWT